MSELYCKVLRCQELVFKPAQGWKLLGCLEVERSASACAPAPQLPLLLPDLLSLSLWETPTSDLCLETSGSDR